MSNDNDVIPYTFEQRHAQIDADVVVELRRRLELWAAAPDSRGMALDAQIVPRQTVVAAIEAIEWLRRERDSLAARCEEFELQHTS